MSDTPDNSKDPRSGLPDMSGSVRTCRDCRYCGPDRTHGLVLCNHESWVHWDEEMRVFTPDFAPDCYSFTAKTTQQNS